MSQDAENVGAQPRAGGHRRLVARNFFSLSVAALAGRVVTLFSGIYIRRVLEVVAIGQLSWCTSVLSYFTLLINPGLETIAKRDVAQDPSRAGRYVSLLLMLQLLLAVSAFIFVAIFAMLGIRGPQISLILTVQAFGLLLIPLNLTWLLHANERMGPAALTEVVSQLLMLPAIILFIHSPAHVVRYVLLAYPLRIGAILYLAWYANRHGLLRWSEIHLTLKGAMPLVQAAIPLGFSQVAILLYYNFDAIFLGFTRGDATVGLYSTAYSLMLMPTLLSSSLTSAYFPALSRASTDPQQRQRVSREFLRVLTWVGFPLAAAGWAVGHHVVDLMYGKDFAASGILFEWLSLNVALVFFNIGMAQPLTAWDHQKIYFKITVVAAIANVLLNIVLIPRYGAPGAVFTTILAEAVVMVGAWMARIRIAPIPVLQVVYRPLVCSAIMAAVVRGMEAYFHTPWWAALVLGMLLFTGCFWFFERETIMGLVKRIWRLPTGSVQ
jgi:O-antigen/teichoic acid export membrane protein